MFDFKLDEIAAWINDGGYASVALQLPEGLKISATEIIDYLCEKTDSSFVVIGEPCYGACDLCVGYRDFAEALVHFGHSPIPSNGSDGNVFYAEVFNECDVKDAVKSVSGAFGDKVGLLATVQYIGCLGQAKAALEESGRTAFIGKGDDRIAYPGQVLGCNCSAAESVADSVDEFLFIGEGDFHPLAAALGVRKKIRVLNPITGDLRDIGETRDRMLRRRFAAIQSASGAENFLVIVSSKVGQNRDPLADGIVGEIVRAGKKAYKVRMSEITPQSLMPYKADAYVNTACPRIVIDDCARYKKPMLTPIEAEIALGLRPWDDYVFDAIRP